MKLYSYYRSSCSYRARIALHHKNIPFEYIPVHLVKEGGEQRQENFTNLNPKGEVPTLIDNKTILSQSVAIFLYLDRASLENPLFPKDFPQFENCFELVELINSGIQPLQNLSVLQKLVREIKATEEQKIEWIKHFISKGLKAYHDKLSSDGPFSLGDEVTAADMFLVPQLYNAHRFEVDFSGMEKLLEIEKACLELDAFKKSHPDVQPDAPR